MVLTYSHSQCPGSQTTIFVYLKPCKTPSSQTTGDKNTIKWVNRTVAFYLTVPGTWSSPGGTDLLPKPRPPERQAKTWILPPMHPSTCRFTLLHFFPEMRVKKKKWYYVVSHRTTKGLSSGGEDLLHETCPRRGYGKATGMKQTKPPMKKGRCVTSLKTPSTDIQQHRQRHHGAFSSEFVYEQHNTGNK